MNVATGEKGNKAGRASEKTAGEGEGKGKVEGHIGRMLVRAIWAQEWMMANPDGKGEERKAAWKEAREAAIEKNLKTYRRAINALTRAGVTMTVSEAAAKTSDEADLGGED